MPDYIDEGGNMQSSCDVCSSVCQYVCQSVCDNRPAAHCYFGFTDGGGTTEVFFVKQNKFMNCILTPLAKYPKSHPFIYHKSQNLSKLRKLLHNHTYF